MADRRIKHDQELIPKIPENERIAFIRQRYNTQPRAGLTAEQYLRDRRQNYIFLGFLSVLVCAIVLVALTITRGSATRSAVSDKIAPEQTNMRPFLERQMAIYEAASKAASAAAFDQGNLAKVNEFVTQFYGPLKTVADRRVVLAAALMRDSLSRLKGRTPACMPDKVSYILADCMRGSIERTGGYSLNQYGEYDYCTKENFEEQLVACGVGEQDRSSMSANFGLASGSQVAP
jgi:hypothetical protein